MGAEQSKPYESFIERTKCIMCTFCDSFIYPPRQIRGRLNRDRGGKKGVRGEEKKEKNELEVKKTVKSCLRPLTSYFYSHNLVKMWERWT